MDTVLMLATDEYDIITQTLRSVLGQSVRVLRPAERTRSELQALIPEADVIVGDWSGVLSLGPEEAALGAHIRLVQQPGTGVNFIDLEAWARIGVPVCNAPGGNADSVAEWTVTAASYLNRSVGWADREVRAGRWPQESIIDQGCRDLGECRVGIVGFGDVGVRSATLFSAYGCAVGYFSRTERPESEFRYSRLDDLVSESDVLVLAVPLTADTRHLIGPAQFDAMPSGAIVVNVARGDVVDEHALVEALVSGRIGGAALDVAATEPIPSYSPLRTAPNVLLSPHVAGGTSTAVRRIANMVARNTAQALKGETPYWAVNRFQQADFSNSKQQ